MEKVNVNTVNGHVFTCNNCKKIHFEFNQFGIDFSSIDIVKNFYKQLVSIDGRKFESLNESTGYNRKIHIPFPNTAIKMMLSSIDLEELKILLSTFIKDYESKEEESRFIRDLSKISSKQLN